MPGKGGERQLLLSSPGAEASSRRCSRFRFRRFRRRGSNSRRGPFRGPRPPSAPSTHPWEKNAAAALRRRFPLTARRAGRPRGGAAGRGERSRRQSATTAKATRRTTKKTPPLDGPRSKSRSLGSGRDSSVRRIASRRPGTGILLRRRAPLAFLVGRCHQKEGRIE